MGIAFTIALMSTALHMAGLLYPAGLAVYLLPYQPRCSKSEAFLQGSSPVLLFPALKKI